MSHYYLHEFRGTEKEVLEHYKGDGLRLEFTYQNDFNKFVAIRQNLIDEGYLVCTVEIIDEIGRYVYSLTLEGIWRYYLLEKGLI